MNTFWELKGQKCKRPLNISKNRSLIFTELSKFYVTHRNYAILSKSLVPTTPYIHLYCSYRVSFYLHSDCISIGDSKKSFSQFLANRYLSSVYSVKAILRICTQLENKQHTRPPSFPTNFFVNNFGMTQRHATYAKRSLVKYGDTVQCNLLFYLPT